MKAIIPAAGFGTRFLPVTKVVPKELLPIAGRPVIDYVVAEAIDAGCTEILIVISRGKEAVRRYFEPAPDLEARLEREGKTEELAAVRAPGTGAAITFTYQEEPRGLGDAVLCGADFAGSDPVIVLLGDAILAPHAASDLVAAHEQTGGSAVAVEHVQPEAVSRYGIVSPAAGGGGTGGVSGVGGANSAASAPWQPALPVPLAGLVEKPSPERAPSQYAIAARYLFTNDLWPLLRATGAGHGGEVQLTDAMDAIARRTGSSPSNSGISAVPIRGVRYDLGNPRDFLEAEIALVRQSSPER